MNLEHEITLLKQEIMELKNHSSARSEQLDRMMNILVGENGDSGIVQTVGEMKTYAKIATWIFGIAGSTTILFLITKILEGIIK